MASAKQQRRGRFLTPQVAAHVYDRIGRLQETQAPIERAALEHLVTAGHLSAARRVLELGCGTGALGRKLLSEVLPADASYTGCDISDRMVALTRHRLEPWPARAEAIQVDGSLPLPRPTGSADRFIAAYVLDLLEPQYARETTDEAHRIVMDGGLLCIASLTYGHSRLGRTISTAWNALWHVSPRLVGGCRPINVRGLLDPHRWHVEEDSLIETYGVASQVVVASRR